VASARQLDPTLDRGEAAPSILQQRRPQKSRAQREHKREIYLA